MKGQRNKGRKGGRKGRGKGVGKKKKEGRDKKERGREGNTMEVRKRIR